MNMDVTCTRYSDIRAEITHISFDERTSLVELSIYVWIREAIAEYSCTTGCLPQRHNSSDRSIASDIMRVVDYVKNNELNDFYFYYSCSIFGAVFNLASATNDDILDLMHNQTGHGKKCAREVC